MPSNLMFADASFPQIQDGDDVKKSLSRVQNYLFMLLEQLRYTLQNLSLEENFNEQEIGAFVDKLKANLVVAQTIISTTVITESLYAQQGDIAQLTVDWLDTSKRIKRYLSQDTSDDNYIEVHDQGISFITATVKKNGATPLTEQMKNRYCEPLYWLENIANAQIIDGYPWIGGKQISTTTKNTGYQVTVYQYLPAVKRKIAFEFNATSGYYVPVDTFGQGDENGNYIGTLQKMTDYLTLGLHLPQGKYNGVFFGADGYADGLNLRKPIRFDFSALSSSNKFTEQIDGGKQVEYSVTKDSSGRITQITDGEGHKTEVIW